MHSRKTFQFQKSNNFELIKTLKNSLNFSEKWRLKNLHALTCFQVVRDPTKMHKLCRS